MTTQIILTPNVIQVSHCAYSVAQSILNSLISLLTLLVLYVVVTNQEPGIQCSVCHYLLGFFFHYCFRINQTVGFLFSLTSCHAG